MLCDLLLDKLKGLGLIPIKAKIMTNIHGTISVVSHGHAALVKDLLEDIAKQDGVANWLIIVTINIPEVFNSIEGLNVKLIENKTPKGFGANHNAAAAAAEGALFLIVNPDIRLTQSDTLDCIARADWGGRPALRAPVVLSPDGGIEDSVRGNLSVPNLLRRVIRKRSGWEISLTTASFFWLAGMFLITPLDAFRAMNGFDERFRMYCEDYDLSARWRVNGGRVEILGDITVIHDARRDSHGSLRHLRWHLSSLFRVWGSRIFWQIVAGRYT